MCRFVHIAVQPKKERKKSFMFSINVGFFSLIIYPNNNNRKKSKNVFSMFESTTIKVFFGHLKFKFCYLFDEDDHNDDDDHFFVDQIQAWNSEFE